MEDYIVTIQNAFEKGSIRDAIYLFESCVRNAFPTFNFRGLELIRFLKEGQYMEGKAGIMYLRSVQLASAATLSGK